MTWAEIARKEFYDAVRARTLQALIGLFVLLGVGTTLLFSDVDLFGGPGGSVEGLIGLLTGVGRLLPIIAILLGYKAVAGQREGGQLHLTLTLPHTRGDVVAGTFVGRAGVLLLPLFLGLGAGLLAALVTLDAVSVATYLGFLLLLALVSLSYLGLAIGLSSALTSTTVVAGLLLGLYVLTQFAWDFLVLLAALTVSRDAGALLQNGPPAWLQYLYLLNPDAAYDYVFNAWIVDGTVAIWVIPVELDAVVPLFGVVVLVAWTVLPLAAGYAVLENADL